MESRVSWYYKLSRSKGKRSRSQHDVKYQQFQVRKEQVDRLQSNLVKITQVRSATCDMFKVTRSDRSEIKLWQICTVKNTWKRRLNAKLLLPFRKSWSLNLMAMSECWREARQLQFLRMHSTNLAENSAEQLVRRPAATSIAKYTAVANFSSSSSSSYYYYFHTKWVFPLCFLFPDPTSIYFPIWQRQHWKSKSCVKITIEHGKAPATDSHQPRVNRLEDVDRRVIRGGVELVTVKHLYLALLPSSADRLGTITKPDLDVCQVMFLLLHFNTVIIHHHRQLSVTNTRLLVADHVINRCTYWIYMYTQHTY